ncbi:MAG: hypothetical protein Q9219_006238 [cf. Caloplaca sp. 3 TL-2023]
MADEKEEYPLDGQKGTPPHNFDEDIQSSTGSVDSAEELLLSTLPKTPPQQPASPSRDHLDRSSVAARVTSVMNNADDSELQRLLQHRFWEVANHPPPDQLRDMVVSILRLVGSRLLPRDAIVLLLQAGLNPALAVRQFTQIRYPRLERDVERAVQPPQPGDSKQEKAKLPRDNDDDLPIPKDVDILMAEDPDNPRAQIPAVYHHQVRRYLIERDIRRYGKYRYRRARGKVLEDQTAPHPDQLDWRFSKREKFPDILLQWKKGDHKDPTDPVGDMYWRGHLVVDLDKRNILDFPHIPSCLAGNIEGGFLEAMERLDGRVKHQDLGARQYTARPKTQPFPKDFKNRDNVLAQRMRERHACISWSGRRCGGEHFPAYIEHLLPEESKAKNTTRGFRDLTDHEIAQLKIKNLGKFPKRSARKDPAKREAYIELEKQRLERYKAIEASKDTQVGTPVGTPGTELNSFSDEVTDEDDKDKSSEEPDIVRKPDARHACPTSKDEEEELHDAMLPTIEHYVLLTGELPVITYWSRSYLEIHWDLHLQLHRALDLPAGEEIPLLGLRRWPGGICGWRSAELSLNFIEEWAAEMKD